MATFIQLSPDPYKERDKTQLTSETPKFVKYTDVNRFAHVRRPTRGTQMRDETFATLEIKTADGRNILLLDSGGLIEKESRAYSAKYSNFLIQNITRNKAEKNQIMHTFGQSFIFFFGPAPNIYTFQGILFNSADFNWKSEFLRNYDLYIRGTQCAIYRTSAYITYDDTLLRGFIIASSVEENAENNEVCPFSFQMIIADDIPTSNIGDPYFSIVTSVLFGNEIVQDPNIRFGKFSLNSDEYIARYNNGDSNFPTYEDSIISSKSNDDIFLNSQLQQYGNLDKTTPKTITDKDDKKFKTKRIKGKIVKNTKIEDANADTSVTKAKTKSLTKRNSRT